MIFEPQKYQKGTKEMVEFQFFTFELMLEQTGDVKGKKVLDIATGGGHTALQFAKAGAEVTAVDLTTEILKETEKY